MGPPQQKPRGHSNDKASFKPKSVESLIETSVPKSPPSQPSLGITETMTISEYFPEPVVHYHKESQKQRWYRRYEELKEFRAKTGNCCPKARCPLGVWVSNQRQQYKLLLANKQSHITAERIDLLNKIDFQWEVGHPRFPTEGGRTMIHEGKTQALAEEAKSKKKKRNGNKAQQQPKKQQSAVASMSPVSSADASKQNVDDSEKGNDSKKGNATKNDNEKNDDNSESSSSSNNNPSDDWMAFFLELENYAIRIGDCNVPVRYKENRGLGRWVENQRRAYKEWVEQKQRTSESNKNVRKKTILTEERVHLLNQLNFEWRLETEKETEEHKQYQAHQELLGLLKTLAPRTVDADSVSSDDESDVNTEDFVTTTKHIPAVTPNRDEIRQARRATGDRKRKLALPVGEQKSAASWIPTDDHTVEISDTNGRERQKKRVRNQPPTSVKDAFCF